MERGQVVALAGHRQSAGEFDVDGMRQIFAHLLERLVLSWRTADARTAADGYEKTWEYVAG